MVQLGYAMSSEEHRPNDLVQHAVSAEQVGFTYALISDHYHPWVDAQGHSPFVWSVIGGIATATKGLRLGTGVTCPTVRIHPAIIAQAAATAASMMPGRFFLGVGTGEALNEHILGDAWPGIDERLDMLEEAIEVMRLLWEGGYKSFRGSFYTVDRARIYTLPEQPVEVYVAASGPKSGELAGQVGDGLIATSPDADLVKQFQGSGGEGKPRVAQMTVCLAETEEQARTTAHKIWPNAALAGQLSQELALPEYYEMAAKSVREEDVAEEVVCSLDPQQHLEKIREYEKAGYDHVYVHQVGPDQERFFHFYQREILPKL